MQNIQISFKQNFNTRQERTKISNKTQKALTTTTAWFTFGVGLDFVSRKCQIFKSPTQNSIFINSIIASTAGLGPIFQKYSIIKVKNNIKTLISKHHFFS